MRDSNDAKCYRALMAYDPGTGIFTWRHTLRGKCQQGSQIGAPNAKGYLGLMYDGRRLLMHRIAWLYVTGHWPRGQIDHINGVKSDNRIANLRDVDASVNAQNRRAPTGNNKAGGRLGVTLRPAMGRYQAQILVEGKNVSLGCYDSPEQAHAVYVEAKRRLHDGCTL